MMNVIARIFNWLFGFNDHIFDWLRDLITLFIYIFMRFVGVTLTFGELTAATYENDQNQQRFNFSGSDNGDGLIEGARQIVSDEEKRGNLIHEKGKNLLTVCSLLFAIIAIFYSSFKGSITILIPLALLLISMFLLLKLLDIRRMMKLSLSNDDATLQKNEFNSMVAQDLCRSASSNSRKNDLLADIYRAAQTYMILSLIAIMVLVSINLAKPETYYKNKTHIENIEKNSTNLKYLEQLENLESLTNSGNNIDSQLLLLNSKMDSINHSIKRSYKK